ncbi:antitoxin [Streptomyces sp. NPDC001275]
MGLLDNMKARIGPAKEKVSDLAQRHGGTIGQSLDKAAKVVDEKTKGKYSDRIHAGTGKAKDAMDRLAHKGGTSPETRTASEAGTSPDQGTGTAPGAPTPPEGPPPTS